MKKLFLAFTVFTATAINSVQATNFSKQVVPRIDHRRSQKFFVENKGQIADQFGNPYPDVKYIFQSHGFRIILKENSWSYEFTKVNQTKNLSSKNISGEYRDAEFDLDNDLQFQTNRTDVHLLNSNLHPIIIAEEPADDVLNFYTGKNSLNGITNVHHFKKITYQNIYPDIDLVWDLSESNSSISMGAVETEYSFIVHPGGNPDLIQLVYDGTSSLHIENNSIQIVSSLGKIEEHSPLYFADDSRRKISGTFVKEGNTITFSQINYDHTKTFIIDPTITYSTYFGGDTTDFSEGIEIDKEGNIIVTGRTGSSSNIATSGAYDNTYSGGSFDIFVLKFNASFLLQWATYFGGDRVDYGWSVAIDSMNNIYLGGESYSDGLATADAEQKTIEGSESDGLVAKFSSNGTLVWCRYFGGSDKDQVLGMTLDRSGRLIITGYTLSTDSIATAGAYKTTYGGNGDIFLAALDTANGNAFWSTYYGANKDDRGHHVAVDLHNQIYLSGTALSTSGIATSGTFHSSLAGSFDSYLVKFSSSGIPIWGTYVGGAYEDRGRDCVIDHDGNIYVTGFSQSDTGIATAGTWKQFRTPGIDSTGYNTLDAYVVKLDTNGQRLWGTYFGDTLSETARGIAVNSHNDIFIAGATYSAHGIANGNAYQTNLGGVSDAYFARFNSDGGLVYSSYFGGSDEEQVGGYGLIIRTDNFDNIYLCSSTDSEDSIATPAAYQTALAGGYDVFIAKFADTLITNGGSNPGQSGFENHFIICPNPAHDLVFVNIDADKKSPSAIKVYSAEGKLVAMKNVLLVEGKNEIQFSVNDFASGIYILSVNDKRSVLRKKFIVE
ncbi:MAG TPA: SBBP repeat-containing protein [Chitinophagales bacterium]|nr:SBBP repeat-containing protein [Chitinophagales bacterium]